MKVIRIAGYLAELLNSFLNLVFFQVGEAQVPFGVLYIEVSLSARIRLNAFSA
jgi:hypothetical protein